MESNPEIGTYIGSFNCSVIIESGPSHTCSGGVLGFHCGGGQGVLNCVDNVNMIVPEESNTRRRVQ
jgi:hypothetical protein